jgi:hypothetical protein
MCHSDCVVCCITGFVREKEIIPFKKGHYDKITKTSTAGKQEAKRVLEFASFTLFYLNEYGLISGSEEELAAVSELMRGRQEGLFITVASRRCAYFLNKKMIKPLVFEYLLHVIRRPIYTYSVYLVWRILLQ